MDVSSRGLDIIKEFEGLRLNAYIDPVGIPTIGYGTIRYPTGRRVAMGDSISEAEAEAFLKFECDGLAEDLTSEAEGVELTQNQFDALVSFCYNLGLGAFLGSTLRRRLKEHDFAGAAAEFPKWNKGKVDGVKVELPGLTRRRAKERALFEDGTPGETPFSSGPSAQERVIKAKGFGQAAANVVAAFDKDGNVVEILKLENSLPDTLVAVVALYPNLEVFDFARAGEAPPPGERVSFTGLGRPIVEVENPPPFEGGVLTIGAGEDEDEGNDIVKEMQERLRELGYFTGKIDGVFERETDAAVREFQAAYFGRSEADGKVGPKTWKKLFGDARPPEVEVGVHSTGTNYLKLTKTNEKDRLGLVRLILAYYKDGDLVESIDVCSGQARKQTFRIGRESPSGSMEPLPEGKWSISNIEWKDGRDNYTGEVWNSGLGPAKIRTDFIEPGSTPRSAIEIHIDWNRSGAPGTAGCIGVQNVADFKKLVTWLRDTDPRDLFVDWGLGTCPQPVGSRSIGRGGPKRRRTRRK